MSVFEPGYGPAMDLQASLCDFVRWQRDMYGLGGPFEDLYDKLTECP